MTARELYLEVIGEPVDPIVVPDDDSPFGLEIKKAREEVRERLMRKAWTGPIGKSALELAFADLPPPTPLIQGLMAVDDVVVLGGAPKGGKTWVEADLAIAVAAGVDVFGEFQVRRKGRVLMICLEDSERALRKRLRALAFGRELTLQAALGNISYSTRHRIDLLNVDDVAGIIASARLLPDVPVLVCIDPLVDAHSADENKNDEMRAVMHRARVIRDILGCAVLIVHHMVKNSGSARPNDGGSVFDKFRGASSIRGAYDVGIAYDVKSKSRGCIKANIDVEMRDEADPGPFGLQLELGDDGQHLTRARWTFWRDRAQLHGVAAEALNEGDAGAVLRLIENEHLRATRDKREVEPLSAAEMSRTLSGDGKVKGWGKDKIGKLAALLVDQKRANFVKKGRLSGYVFREPGGEAAGQNLI